jgi:nitroimidazol reductase NimA-like FMN-containing flavoprotein (pyridoxamine 5'-phosphate oxidase superfamily)
VVEPEMVLEDLSRAECLELLAARHFGRIGVVADGQPIIFPVNYVFDDGHMAVRTDPGAKLTAAAQGRVAFEVDEIDESSRIGRSILVTGVGWEVTDGLDATSVTTRRFSRRYLGTRPEEPLDSDRIRAGERAAAAAPMSE